MLAVLRRARLSENEQKSCFLIPGQGDGFCWGFSFSQHEGLQSTFRFSLFFFFLHFQFLYWFSHWLQAENDGVRAAPKPTSSFLSLFHPWAYKVWDFVHVSKSNQCQVQDQHLKTYARSIELASIINSSCLFCTNKVIFVVLVQCSIFCLLSLWLISACMSTRTELIKGHTCASAALDLGSSVQPQNRNHIFFFPMGPRKTLIPSPFLYLQTKGDSVQMWL